MTPDPAPLTARLADAVAARRDDAVALLEELVAIKSINPDFPGVERADVVGGESACTALLGERLAAAGMETTFVAPDPDRRNLVARLPGAGGGRSLALNGHVDTVPPTRSGSWRTGDPWTTGIEDGRLYGLGSTDMKGGLTAGWLAVRALADAGVRLKGDLLLHAAVGEEQMQHELGTTACIEAGPAPDGAIVLEPSSTPRPLTISPVSPGNWVFTIVVPGRSTHAGNRAEATRPGGVGDAIGANAVEKGLLVVQALQGLEAQWGITKRHPSFAPGFFTILPGAFHADAGTPSPAYFADEARIEVLLWYPPQEDPADVAREVEQHVLAAAQLDPWLREHPPAFEWNGNWPAADTPWDHPLVATLRAAHEASTGTPVADPGPGNPVAFGAVSDASFYEAKGIPSVVFGPGDVARAHAADESIILDEITTAATTLALAIAAWCGVVDEDAGA